MKNAFLECFNEFENNNNKIKISQWLDGDDLYDRLEKSMIMSDILCIEHDKLDLYSSHVIQCFINKYKDFIEFTFMFNNKPNNQETMYIKMKSINRSKVDSVSYKELVSKYDSKYYLEDCGGYNAFVETRGRVLDPRLQDVLNLVNPQHGQHILDVGCGRGELSYIIHLSGAKVIGIDYSKEAIDIANNTYQCIKNDNLKYMCQDIFNMDDSYHFDKIVMADIVEHIEQPMLEKLFIKLAGMLKEDGILIIHTAPNKDHYDYYYPQKVIAAKELNIYMPKNPRSYYEELMHINEQNPNMLEESLKLGYQFVKVWTGGVNDIFTEKSYELSILDNSIFALAGNNEDIFEHHMHSFFVKPNSNNVGIKISINSNKLQAAIGSIQEYKIEVKNIGSEVLNSYGKYSTNISYHILDSHGNIVVFDGRRTKLSKLLNPDESSKEIIFISIPDDLSMDEKYIIRVTMVTEGCFWFDSISADYVCDIDLDII